MPSTYLLRSAKIAAYLLNLDHPRGRSKAKFFLDFGFQRDDPQRLADAILKHAVIANFARDSVDDRGHRVLEFEGPIAAPDGRSPRVKSVWIVMPPDSVRFVTAHPLPRRAGRISGS